MSDQDKIRVSESDVVTVAEDALRNADAMDDYPEHITEAAERLLYAVDESNDQPDRDGVETDWLANSVYGYGFGYTQEQALYAMLSHIRSVDSETEVQFVEHIGGATVSMGGWDVDEFVSGEVVTFSPDQLEPARKAASQAFVAVERALDDPEDVEEITFD